jgi:hypothetical protein
MIGTGSLAQPAFVYRYSSRMKLVYLVLCINMSQTIVIKIPYIFQAYSYHVPSTSSLSNFTFYPLSECIVAVPWLKRLAAGLSPRRPGFAPGSIHVGFVVDKVALGQVFLRVLPFSPASIIPPLLHIHLSPPRDVCDTSDQSAHYHHLGPKLGAWFLTRYFGWKQNKKVKNRKWVYSWASVRTNRDYFSKWRRVVLLLQIQTRFF